MRALEGPRVRLRPLRPEEHATVFAWYRDPEVVSPFDRYLTDTFEEFARSVESAASDPASLAPRYGIERKAEGDLVGVVGHYRAHPVLEFVDVWYLIGEPAARGHGVGRESVGLLVDEVFRTSAVERVGATCDVENIASARLVEGLGFRLEGTLRSALYHHGRWHDVRVYGITRPEWAAVPRPA
jgi:[ribosomal protein S5]-alanine N-acetyltransferase